MSDLGWRADGIARAEAAGAVTLEVYRKPGFTGQMGVRRLRGEPSGGTGFEVAADPTPEDWDARAQRGRRNAD